MSECEVATVYKTSEPVARKDYDCCECSAPILKGEKHFHGSGIWSYGFASYRQHLLCMRACMLIRDEHNDRECIGFGELFEWVGENRRRLDEREYESVRHLRDVLAAIEWRKRKTKE